MLPYCRRLSLGCYPNTSATRMRVACKRKVMAEIEFAVSSGARSTLIAAIDAYRARAELRPLRPPVTRGGVFSSEAAGLFGFGKAAALSRSHSSSCCTFGSER